MFIDKKIRFIQNGIFIPEVGRVYHGKEAFFSPKAANRLVNLGYAEFVVDKTEQVAVEYKEKKVKKYGKSRKSDDSEGTSEDNS